VEFTEAYQNKITGDIDGLMINFINLDDFIKNKEATGSAKDLGDIELLKQKK